MPSDTPPANVWTVREIVDYTDNYRATFCVRSDGSCTLTFPVELNDRWGNVLTPRERAGIIAAVMPHVRARKAELIESLSPKDYYPPVEKPEPEDVRDTLAEAIQARAGTIAILLTRAEAGGLAVWSMAPPDLRPVAGKVVSPAARFACVEGDTEWVRLPDIDGAEPEPVKKPKAKARAR